MKLKQLLSLLVFLVMGMFATVGYAINTVTGVSAPATAAVGASVSISVQGDSGVCTTEIDYTTNGSWDASNPGAQFPHGYSHVYTAPGVITITARGTGICSGTASTTINITAVPGNVTSVTGPNSGTTGNALNFQVGGTGVCTTLTISWGEGPNTVRNNYNLAAPINIGKTYSTIGSKTITATGSGGCTGSANKAVNITSAGGSPGSISTVSSVANVAYAGVAKAFRVHGTGVCSNLLIQYGAGGVTSRTNYNLATASNINLIFNNSGWATVTATGSGSCSGSASKSVIVQPNLGKANPGGSGLDISKFKYIKFKPKPGPKPCLSCPSKLRKIRYQEAQMRKYQRMMKKGGTSRQKRLWLQRFKMNKSMRGRLIRGYKRAAKATKPKGMRGR